jgi:hypothetical protein
MNHMNAMSMNAMTMPAYHPAGLTLEQLHSAGVQLVTPLAASALSPFAWPAGVPGPLVKLNNVCVVCVDCPIFFFISGGSSKVTYNSFSFCSFTRDFAIFPKVTTYNTTHYLLNTLSSCSCVCCVCIQRRPILYSNASEIQQHSTDEPQYQYEPSPPTTASSAATTTSQSYLCYLHSCSAGYSGLIRGPFFQCECQHAEFCAGSEQLRAATTN